MILVEVAEHHVTLHNGFIKAVGPMSKQMGEIAREAVKRAGCRPEDGEPDMHAARILMAEHGGRILEYKSTTDQNVVY